MNGMKERDRRRNDASSANNTIIGDRITSCTRLVCPILGGNGPPFNRYSLRYGISVQQQQQHSDTETEHAPAACSRFLQTLRDVGLTEGVLLAGLTVIVLLYAVDYAIDWRRNKFYVHLSLCTANTVLSLVHIGLQLYVVLHNKPTKLYEQTATELLPEPFDVDVELDAGVGRSAAARFISYLRCSTGNDVVFMTSLGVAVMFVDVVLLIVFLAYGKVDVGWTLLPNVAFPILIQVLRYTVTNRSHRKWMQRDADVHRTVVLEAAYLMRELMLLNSSSMTSSIRKDNSSPVNLYNGPIITNDVSSDVTTVSSFELHERRRLLTDNAQRFLVALKNTPCYGRQRRSIGLYQPHLNTETLPRRQGQGQSADRHGGNNVDRQMSAQPVVSDVVECRLVSVTDARDLNVVSCL